MSVVTYLLENITVEDIAALHAENPDLFEVNPHTGYGIFVAEKPPKGAGKFTISRELPGDNSDVVREWLKSKALQKVAEEQAENPAGEEARSAALAGWQEARKKREALENKTRELLAQRKKAQAELAEAIKAEERASREMVRTHGRRVVWIDGRQWEPVASRADTIFYRRKR